MYAAIDQLNFKLLAPKVHVDSADYINVIEDFFIFIQIKNTKLIK